MKLLWTGVRNMPSDSQNDPHLRASVEQFCSPSGKSSNRCCVPRRLVTVTGLILALMHRDAFFEKRNSTFPFDSGKHLE